MHNAAFAAMGLNARYEACPTDSSAAAVLMIRQRGLRGASVTLPFKEAILPLLDEADPEARDIGAVNTIVHTNGRLKGYNTDGPGLVRDLEEWIGIRGRSFLIIGAGGAARAAVFALIQAGGVPIVVNRTADRAQALADRFGCRWGTTGEIGRLEADCLINTTPVGMFPSTGETPLPGEELGRFPYVMDMIYNPLMTRLLREAKAAGCAVRSGVGMFVHQGAEQIRLWTGREPPREHMRQVVLERMQKDGGD
jgi:shikimate dehydrogenase